MPTDDHTSDGEREKDSKRDAEVPWKDFSGKDKDSAHERVNEDKAAVWARGTASEDHHEDKNRSLSQAEKQIINHAPGRSGSNTSRRMSQIDKVKITGALCDRLDTSSFEKREAQRIMYELNLDQFGNQKRVEKVALVVIRYVVDRTRFKRASESENPQVTRIASKDTYKELIDEQGMDLGDVMSLSGKVKKVLKGGSNDD